MSSTPTLANKTTISSRSKINAQLNNNGTMGRTTLTMNRISEKNNNNIMPPPSLIARNSDVLKAQTTNCTNNSKIASRLANLADGLPSSIKHNGTNNAIETKTNALQTNNINSNKNIPRSQFATGIASTPKAPTGTTSRTTMRLTTIKPAYQRTTALLHPQTTAKPERKLITSATTLKKPSAASSAASLRDAKQTSQIPDTNQIRKGLAKFSNPMECQRQFQALNSKIEQLETSLEARDKTVSGLQDQLKQSIRIGVGYATAVQYLASKLKLDSEIDLTKECKELKEKVNELTIKELEHENRVETIIDEYKNHLQVEIDLRNQINKELEETKKIHFEFIEKLKETHKSELEDLNNQNSKVQQELKDKIERLESELDINIKELTELRKEHEILTSEFNKLEESLTKDKDAKVKYLHEKINQLQKDVDSLNSVLEMRLEKIHILEKDSLLLTDAQNDLKSHKDTIKALNQQIESVNAALDKKREEFEALIGEHEKLRQELLKERTERRRMTMKSEQLEYVLNESCASESNLVFNSSIRDVDNDHLI